MDLQAAGDVGGERAWEATARAAFLTKSLDGGKVRFSWSRASRALSAMIHLPNDCTL
jgi:hypothetical protein